MVKIQKKFRGTDTDCRAIAYMIGQSVEVFNSEPVTSEIAAWMLVSKPTARRHLNLMVKYGMIDKITVPYKANATIDKWVLTEDWMNKFKSGKLKWAYGFYAQHILKVILT